jgi:hypothetical protein
MIYHWWIWVLIGAAIALWRVRIVLALAVLFLPASWIRGSMEKAFRERKG